MVYMPYYDYEGENMSDFRVIAYEKENGEVPVEEFLDSNGFVKKTQKTPQEEIQLAKDRRKDFIERVMNYENIG